MKTLLAALALATSGAQATEPPECSQVQYDVVKRIEAVRGIDKNGIKQMCHDGMVFFVDPNIPFVFNVTKDKEVFICSQTSEEEFTCVDPIPADVAVQIFKKRYERVYKKTDI